MQECGYYVKRAIIRRYVYEVGDVFNWIIEPLTDLYIAETSRDDIPDGKENNLIPDSYPAASRSPMASKSQQPNLRATQKLTMATSPKSSLRKAML